MVAEIHSTYISLRTIHRLEDNGITDLEMIELKSTRHLGEDHIVRIEDTYRPLIELASK